MVKQCAGCAESKPHGEFYKRSRHDKYPDSNSGYSDKCKACTYEDRQKYKAANPDKVRDADINSRLKRVYGIDLNDYNQMFVDQKGRCIGCDRPQSELTFKLSVDHCHATDAVRGLLCINCNAILGQARDSVNVLQNLIAYLNKFSVSAANEINTDLLKVG